MLLPLPIPYRPRRKVPNVVAEPTSQTITVTSVVTDDPATPARIVWNFSTAVLATDLVTGLLIRFGGVWMEPVYVDVTGSPSTELVVIYDTTESLADCVWSITTTPSGIVEASEIVVPQSGIVVEI